MIRASRDDEEEDMERYRAFLASEWVIDWVIAVVAVLLVVLLSTAR